MFMGDFHVGDTIDLKFTSRRFSTGAPHTLANTPVVSAYPDNSTTQITAGITLSVDFDSVTGLNNVRVVATGGNGYSAGVSYALVITTGTVDSVSVVGEVVGLFTLDRGAAFGRLGAPAGASVSADIAAMKVDTAAILVDTGTTLDGRIPAALVSGRMDASVGAMAANVLTATAIAADAITAAKIANGAIDAATFAADVDAEILSYLVDDATRLDASALNGLDAKLDTIDNFLDTEVAAILAAVDTEVAAILALLDDARTEPAQGNPPVNPDLATKIDYLYKAWRNKKDNDGTETKLYADDGSTVDHKQSTEESAGTVTKGEWVTGA